MNRTLKARPTSAPARWVGATLLAAAAAGCGGGNGQPAARPLTAEQFAARNGVSLDDGRSAGQPVERSGAVPYDTERTRLATPRNGNGDAGLSNPAPEARPQRISPAVTEAVSRPYSAQAGVEGIGGPGTRPASAERVDLPSPSRVPSTAPAAAEGGPRSLDVFFVVKEVNGQPIFSDKVLGVLEKPLAAEAKRNTRDNFAQLAAAYLAKQVSAYEQEELEVAAAERALDAADKQLAQAVTMQWRQRQETAAGGSREMARRRAAADGWDFDDLVKQQYRLHLVQLYYQKRVMPLVQVPAADIRAYYERNKDKEFSTPGRMRFRVVRIDRQSPKYASQDAAAAAAERVRDKAGNADFATLAADPQYNDDPTSRERGGYVREDGWVPAGSYRFEEVEKAVAAVRPGGVTNVVQAGPYLFVAKLEEVQEAKVRPFEDPQVQDKIAGELRRQQITAMRLQHAKALKDKAVTQDKPGAMDTLLAIVMQRYPDWAGNGRG